MIQGGKNGKGERGTGVDEVWGLDVVAASLEKYTIWSVEWSEKVRVWGYGKHKSCERLGGDSMGLVVERLSSESMEPECALASPKHEKRESRCGDDGKEQGGLGRAKTVGWG